VQDALPDHDVIRVARQVEYLLLRAEGPQPSCSTASATRGRSNAALGVQLCRAATRAATTPLRFSGHGARNRSPSRSRARGCSSGGSGLGRSGVGRPAADAACRLPGRDRSGDRQLRPGHVSSAPDGPAGTDLSPRGPACSWLDQPLARAPPCPIINCMTNVPPSPAVPWAPTLPAAMARPRPPAQYGPVRRATQRGRRGGTFAAFFARAPCPGMGMKDPAVRLVLERSATSDRAGTGPPDRQEQLVLCE
jgi:hypothetical protein